MNGQANVCLNLTVCPVTPLAVEGGRPARASSFAGAAPELPPGDAWHYAA